MSLPCRRPTHVEPHVDRVTLHPRLIAAARRVVLITTGAGKADLLARAWGGADVRELPVGAARLPQRRVAARRGGRGPSCQGRRRSARAVAGAIGRAALPRSPRPAGHRPGWRADRGLRGRRRPAAGPGPRHDRRPPHLARRRTGPRHAMAAPRDRPARTRRLRGRGRGRLRHRARVRRPRRRRRASWPTETGGPVDVVGHSLGGRIALGASLRTAAIRRVVAYEGAPLAPGEEAIDPALEARLREDLAAGDLDGMLARFMTEAIGMPAADLAAFRADPIWPLRAAAAPTILRELDAAEHAPAAGLDALAAVTVPVLQLVGSLSPASFRIGAQALDRRLADGRLEVIDGARHGAHHSHAAEFIARVEAFATPIDATRLTRHVVATTSTLRRRRGLPSGHDPTPRRRDRGRPTLLARSRGRRRRRDRAVVHRRGRRPAAVSRLSDRGAGPRGHLPRHRRAPVDGQLGPARQARLRPRPGPRADGPARAPDDRQADGRAAHGGLGVGRDGGPRPGRRPPTRLAP